MPPVLSVGASKEGEIRRVYPVQLEGQDFDVNIIYVPELRRVNAPQDSYIWLKDLPESTTERIQVFEFSYGWHDTGLSIWQSLIQRSEQLSEFLRNNSAALGVLKVYLCFPTHADLA